MHYFNLVLRIINCSWCGCSYLWGKIPLPINLDRIQPSHGICRHCSKKLVAEMDRYHAEDFEPLFVNSTAGAIRSLGLDRTNHKESVEPRTATLSQ